MIPLLLVLALGYALLRESGPRPRPTSPRSPSPSPSPRLPTPAPGGLADPLPAPPHTETASDDIRSYYTIWNLSSAESRDRETRLLASAIASAKRAATVEEARALGWALRNNSLLEDMPLSSYLEPGRDKTMQAYSTMVTPTDRDVTLAESILEAPQTMDQSWGSVAWINVPQVDYFARKNPSNPSLASIRNGMASVGLVHRHTAGDLEFYGY